MIWHLDWEKYSEESDKAQLKIIQDHVWDARGVYNSTNNGIQVGNNRIHATKKNFYCIYKVFHTLSNHEYDPLMLLLTMVTRTASEPTEGRSEVPSSPLLKEMGYYQIKTLAQKTCDWGIALQLRGTKDCLFSGEKGLHRYTPANNKQI